MEKKIQTNSINENFHTEFLQYKIVIIVNKIFSQYMMCKINIISPTL